MKYVLLLMSVLAIGCSSSKNTITPEMANANKELVESKNFKIEQRQAHPMPSNSLNQIYNANLLGFGNNNSSISIEGRGDFLEIEGTTARANMSFYGEMRSTVALTNTTGGIVFEGEVRDYEHIYDVEHSKSLITFKVRDNSESFDVTITVFANGKTTTIVHSSHRSYMRYTGTITEVEQEV